MQRHNFHKSFSKDLHLLYKTGLFHMDSSGEHGEHDPVQMQLMKTWTGKNALERRITGSVFQLVSRWPNAVVWPKSSQFVNAPHSTSLLRN